MWLFVCIMSKIKLQKKTTLGQNSTGLQVIKNRGHITFRDTLMFILNSKKLTLLQFGLFTKLYAICLTHNFSQLYTKSIFNLIHVNFGKCRIYFDTLDTVDFIVTNKCIDKLDVKCLD